MARGEVSNPGYKKTSTEHFSPLSDQHTSTANIPPCVTCGALSEGGRITRMEDHFMELAFYCRTCAEEPHFAVASTSLWPYYEILADLGRGRLRVRRLDRDQAMKRFTVRT